MKKQKPFIVSFLVLQIILLISANNAFAFSTNSLDLDSRQGEFFKTDQNKKAVLFEESISETSFHTPSENENDFIQFDFKFPFEYDFLRSYSESPQASEYEPNRRSILKIQIFPFHFFW